MDTSLSKPKLRWPLDIRLHEAGGQQVLVLQCPVGISEKPLFLVPAVGPIISLFDGALSRQEILAHFAPHGLTDKTLSELIALLDQHLFLANERFFAAGESAREAFEKAEVRAPALAGRGYPAARQELEAQISGYMAHSAAASEVSPTPGLTSCLVAPHIDYHRGGRCYGVTYPHLRGAPADLYVLMGTAHQYSERLFHLCAKDFASPLGRLACDTELVTQIAARHGLKRSFEAQFLHKREHSLELQLPFLGTVQPGAKIAPILAGSFHRSVARQRPPQETEEYESFVGALCEAIREREAAGQKVCWIAGVDMAHVGKSFGDDDPLTPEKMAQVAERDRQYLSAILRLDKEALFSHLCEDGDARRICGFPTMYTILDVFDRLAKKPEVSLVSYEQAIDYPAECAVTFAGMVMREV